MAVVGDVLIISGAASLANKIWLGDWAMPIKYVYPVLLQVLLCVNVFRWRRLYELETYANRTEHLLQLAGSFGLISLIIVGMGFGFKTSAEFSRMWFGLWTLLALTGLSLWFVLRSTLVRKVQAKGQLRDRLLVVGSPQAAHDFTDWLDIYAPRRARILGVVTTGGPGETEVNGHRILGDLEALAALAERLLPDKVVLLVDWSDSATIDSCLEELRSMALDVELVLPRIGETWTHRHVTHVGGTPAINLMRKPLSEAAHMAKGVEDYVLATLMLVLLSPVFLVIAGLMKISSRGPVFYRQLRVGFQKREFDIFKFRTMRIEDNNGFKQATRDDDRVTWIGKFLRRTSLDEIPQLFNVIRGEMSIVGPRAA